MNEGEKMTFMIGIGVGALGFALGFVGLLHVGDII